jgi:autotransporter-associated beta strand protein
MRISLQYILYILITCCLLSISNASLYAIKTATGGLWNSSSTWNNTGVPSATDVIVIPTGITVTMNVDYTTSASLTLGGSGTLDMNGHYLTIGSLLASGSAILKNTGMSNLLTVGSDNSTTSYTGVLSNNIQFIKNGSGTLTLSTGTSSLISMEVDAGTLSITSGSYTLSANTGVYVNGGILNVSGGTITGAGGSFFNVSNGSANISGGTISAYFLVIGWNHDVTVTISGGSNTFTEVRHQDAGTGTLTLNSGGSVTATVVRNNSDGGGTDGLIVNLNTGSTITTGSFGMNSTAMSGTHTTTLNLNGGTITANAGGNLFDAVSGGGTGQSITVVAKAGGATINTNGNDCYLYQSITHDAGLGGTADGGITKTGTNHLRFTQNNSYTGGTTISNGDIVLYTATGFGTGTVNVSTGAYVLFWAPSALTVATNFILNGSSGNTSYPTLCHDGGSGLVTLNGTITLNGNTEVGLGGNSGNNMVINGVISGTGSLTIDEENTAWGLNDRTTTLTGANTYTGSTIISGGTLQLGVSSNLTTSGPLGTNAGGVSITSGATLDMNGFSIGATNAEAITINGTGISGSGAIMNSSTTTATYAGLVKLGSTSSIQGETGLLAISNAGTITGSGFGLTLGGTQGGSLSSILGTGAGTLTKEDAGTWTLSGHSTFTGATTVNGGTLKTTAGNSDPGAIGKSSGLTINTGATVLVSGFSNSLFFTNNVPVSIIGGTLTTDNGFACNIYGVITLTGGTLASGTPEATFGSWILQNDVSVTGNTASTISATDVNLVKSGGVTFTVADGTAASDLNFTGTLWKSASLTETAFIKAGAGTVTLSGVNSIDGGVTLNAGTININNASALGATAGTFTIANGTSIDNTSGGAITLSTNNSMTWNGDFTFTGSNSLNLGTGAVNMVSASRAVTVSASILTVGGTISGTGLTKSGNGTMALGSVTASNWSGITTVNAGTLQLGNPGGDNYLSSSWIINSGGTIEFTAINCIVNNAVFTINSGGTLDMKGFHDTFSSISGAGNLYLGTATLILTLGSTTTFSGVISGSGNLDIDGTGGGVLTLSGLNTYTGWTRIRASSLNINTIGNVNGGASALGNPSSIANGTIQMGSTTTTGTLVYTGTAQTTNRVINLNGTTGGATIDQSGTGALVFSSALTATGSGVKTLTLQGSTAGTGEISGAIIDGSGTTAITKTGTGTWTLSGANTFSGGANLNVGQLNINNATALGTGIFTIANNTTIDNTSGGAITLTTNNPMTWNGDFTFTGSKDLNLGTGTVTMGSSLRTVTTSAGTLTVGGTITGTGGLTKSGLGTMTLGAIAADNWTGPTTINGGIFNLGTQGSSDWYKSTSWTVNSGATLFQSSGNILTNFAVITVNSGGTWNMNNKGDAIAYVAGTGNITNMGGITLDIGTNGNGSNFSGIISGGGSITVRGNNNSGAGT